MDTRGDIDGLGDSKLISTCGNNPRLSIPSEKSTFMEKISAKPRSDNWVMYRNIPDCLGRGG
jgi:hypothetical protein